MLATQADCGEETDRDHNYFHSCLITQAQSPNSDNPNVLMLWMDTRCDEYHFGIDSVI